jgi:YVTN family beta-propeller protein
MTADGQPACTPAPIIKTPIDRIDDSIGLALVTLLGRRALLRAAAGGLATLMLAACSASPNGSSPSGAAPSPAPGSKAAPSSTSPSARAVAGEGKAPWVYVFNVGSKDVSIIDSATNKVVATRPLGAAVRWLSNEQRYWDGTNIWTYDFPNNNLQTIAIDPKEVKVVRTIDTGTKGPGHSLMLTPDKKTALLNSAGSDVINVIDVAAGEVVDKIETGKFP